MSSKVDADGVADYSASVRPWRSLAVCSALVLTFVFVGRDLKGSDLNVLGGLINLSGGDFILRIIEDPYRLFLACLIVTVIVFSFIQIALLRSDLAALRKGRIKVGLVQIILRQLACRSIENTFSERESQALLSWAGIAISGPLRLGVVVFPMLGFLGTVVGLSGAIEALPDAMQSEGALGDVLGQLHVAFDTTLLGLIGALICVFGSKIIDETLVSIDLILGT